MSGHPELVPLDAPPHDRPRGVSQPCAACGAMLDPLRAQRVLVFDDGYRYLCDGDCATDFRSGRRHRAKLTPSTRSTTDTLLGPPESARTQGRLRALEDQYIRGPWLGIGAVLAAVVLGFFSTAPAAVLASALCSSAAACAVLWASWPTAREVGFLAWALGPAGVVGAAISAHAGIGGGSATWLSLEGAALAAAAMVARTFFDGQARVPVQAAAQKLVENLPGEAHVPVAPDADPLRMQMDRVPVERLRTGEEFIAMRGEVVPCDGVIQAGDARVLPYPGALTALSRGAGDPVLAGARVQEGSLRVLATRVGPNRALWRLAHFGHSAVDRQASPLARTLDMVNRWGGAVTLALAAAVILVSDSGGMTAPLSAASAVLLAAPLLAIRRGAESPQQAAAASAGARGIVYQSPRALDRVGAVSIVAMSPHGTLTEGRTEVVECTPLGQAPIEPLLALAAGAERAAEGHRLARAIERYARAQRVTPAEVRRPVHLRGAGVTAVSAEGMQLVVGSRRLLLDEGVSVAAAESDVARAEAAGRTPVLVALDGRVRAVIAIEHSLRVGARAAIQRLFDMNLEVVLLTGDQRLAVENLAAGLEVRHIKAELLPDERGEEVRSLRGAGGRVAAVGRPGEDDAALAAADVGIVLGAAGGAAGERAVALVGDDIRDAAAALWIAHAARDGAQKATRLAAIAFATIVAAAAAGLIEPGIAALASVAIDAYGVRAGARLLRRIALRLPART